MDVVAGANLDGGDPPLREAGGAPRLAPHTFPRPPLLPHGGLAALRAPQRPLAGGPVAPRAPVRHSWGAHGGGGGRVGLWGTP